MARNMKATDLKEVVQQAGGTYAVARACGLSPSAVSQWIAAGRLPVTDLQGHTDYASQILELSGMEKVDVWDLRLIGRR